MSSLADLAPLAARLRAAQDAEAAARAVGDRRAASNAASRRRKAARAIDAVGVALVRAGLSSFHVEDALRDAGTGLLPREIGETIRETQARDGEAAYGHVLSMRALAASRAHAAGESTSAAARGVGYTPALDAPLTVALAIERGVQRAAEQGCPVDSPTRLRAAAHPAVLAAVRADVARWSFPGADAARAVVAAL